MGLVCGRQPILSRAKILPDMGQNWQKYNKGKGLKLFKDNILVANSNKIEKLTYIVR